jgi:hypothetical protein
VGYPDNVLAQDEQVVLYRHPHWKRLISAVLVLVISSGLAAFVCSRQQGHRLVALQRARLSPQ